MIPHHSMTFLIYIGRISRNPRWCINGNRFFMAFGLGRDELGVELRLRLIDECLMKWLGFSISLTVRIILIVFFFITVRTKVAAPNVMLRRCYYSHIAAQCSASIVPGDNHSLWRMSRAYYTYYWVFADFAPLLTNS